MQPRFQNRTLKLSYFQNVGLGLEPLNVFLANIIFAFVYFCKFLTDIFLYRHLSACGWAVIDSW